MGLKELRRYMSSVLGSDFFVDPYTMITRLPTGFYQLDNLLGGGFREGKMVEFYGPPGSSKTFLANNLMSQAQQHRPDSFVGFLDFELSFDPERAESLGVDLDRVHYAQPYGMEAGFDGLKEMLQSDVDYSLIVIDSISAMSPKKEAEESVEKHSVASQARINTIASRVITPLASKKKTTIVFTNQVRDNIGVMYGPTTKTSGGNAIKHFCDTRLSFARIKSQDKEEVTTPDGKKEKVEKGFEVKVKLEKHRGKGETRSCVFHYIFDLEDIDRTHDLMNHLTNKGLIQTNGPSVRLSGVEKAFKGKKRLREYLENNPDEVERLVKEANQLNELKEQNDKQEPGSDTSVDEGVEEPLEEQS